MLCPYTDESDVTEDGIDDELRDAQTRMTTLLKQNRLRSNALPQKINDFKLLVELRDLLRTPPVTGTLCTVDTAADDDVEVTKSCCTVM